jgi:hypothetical protein
MSSCLTTVAAEAERLQVADVIRAALVFRHDVVHLQGPLMLMGAATLAAASGPGEHSVLHRTADRAAVSGAMGEHLLAPLLTEPVQPLAAQLQQCVAPIAVAGDAVAGEHAAHHPFPRIRRAMSCAGAGLWRPSSSMSISG